jgi:hypothetical protein
MKNIVSILTGRVLLAAVLLAFFAVLWSVHAHDNEHEGRYGGRLDVAPVTNALYTKECGSCHFAYPPGLLPERSWSRLMAGLEDHFGDNAELAAEDREALLSYLKANAADRSYAKASVKFSRSIAALSTPLRITEVPYFVREHREIPAHLYASTSAVKSISNCKSCHTLAERGSFNEHSVEIPGYGRWD